MTECHNVQSSSRLIDNKDNSSIEDEEEIENIVDTNTTKNSISFYQQIDEDNIDQKDYENNKILHQKRHRTLSMTKDFPNKIKIDKSNIINTDENRKRRTNSFNGVKLPLSHTQSTEYPGSGYRKNSNRSDKIDIKSSFKRILNAGKQIVPEFQHSMSVHSVKSNTPQKKQSLTDSISFRYNRSQSYNQNHEFEDEDGNIFNENELNAQGGQYDAYLEQKNSKLNFLSKSYEEKSNIHNNFQKIMNTPASVAEEGSLSSQSQSSTPSSSISKNNSLSEEKATLLNDHNQREKLFTDENNNLENYENIGTDLELKLLRSKKNNDSIRMRHNSSKGVYLQKNNKSDMNLKLKDQLTELGNSNCILVSGLDSQSSSDDGRVGFLNSKGKKPRTPANNYFVITLLFLVNLLNYIDRYTLAGVLRETQDYFNISDSESGLLQTVFICSYMLLAPLFGYLGDRYPRKWLIIFGITFWSLMTLAGSFVPKDMFWLFVLIRSFVGIGEASYSCVAPTIIGDLFTAEKRTRMLAIFYLAVPVGSGMGYIVGSNIAQLFGDWRWSLRFTPAIGILCVILLIFFVQEPKRGGAEGSNYETSKSSMFDDVLYLLKNKSFIWVTMGFTFASFVLGGLSWWVPTYVEYAIYSKNEEPVQIPLVFGIITCFSGLFGVVASSVLAPKLRTLTKKADPIVCAMGSLISVPTLFILILITRSSNQILFWFIACIAISAMCLSWTIVADILLYVIHPNKRSIASAINILICHLLGDAFSPYVIGAISDSLRAGKPDTYYNRFTSLQLALYAGPFFALLSFACYLFAALFIEDDKKQVELIIKKSQKNLSEPSLNAEGPINNDIGFASNLSDDVNENCDKNNRARTISGEINETNNHDKNKIPK